MSEHTTEHTTHSEDAPIIIVGAGMAAYSLAREFRKLDQVTPLMLVSRDAAGAYAKPMLSNAFALGKAAPQLVSHSAEQMAVQLKASVLGGAAVTAIDTAARRIDTDAGSFGYRQLVLALGAEPIRVPLAGDGADEVLSVNHIDDYTALRARLATAGPGARVAILGAGLIGCEFADDLVAGGHPVTLIDPNPRPLAALAAPSLSAALTAAWAASPISLRLGTSAASVRRKGGKGGKGGVLVVALADGSEVEAELVLSAVGLRPSIALARAAGLSTRCGIVLDAFGQTSAAGVYALGDCAEYAHAEGGAVLPYVAPLLAAARAIAATLAGRPTALALKTEAVIVKTPSCRLALAPPPPGAAGEWHSVTDAERTVARFVDGAGKLRGFGLSAPSPALRQGLLAELFI
ncbi:MAG: FAD-dependent oxidoreductase [Massilia sp.]